jgi:thiamine biosynthesis lipoprotein
MATVFEWVMFEESVADAQAAASAAFQQIDALEQKLSFFISHSDMSRINGLSAGCGVIVSVDAFACLQIAQAIHLKTGGAFDPTTGALVTGRTPWNAMDRPSISARSHATAVPRQIGFHLLRLDPATRLVSALADDVKVDLGAIGKGFALDMAAEIMRDYGIGSALLSAGQSTMLPIGLPPDQNGWSMLLRDPRDETTVLHRVLLRTGALSTSAVADDPHILDPASGLPTTAAIGAWACAPTAAESDALSTAFVVMRPDAVRDYCQRYPQVGAGMFSANGEFTAINL